MEISTDLKIEIQKQVLETFTDFVKEKGLTTTSGGTFSLEALQRRVNNAKEFSECCKISVPYSSEEELNSIKYQLSIEVSHYSRQLMQNYN